jgi:tRNA modification GTPase
MADGSSIFALSSGAGRAGIAVIRVSGPAARDVLARMAPPLAAPRHAAFRTIRHPETGDALDRAVVIFFEAKSSETGEDVAELQVHGGRAVVRAVLDAVAAIPECRPAEPGEFALRAFENGKIDLAEVEGLADLVDAETEAQRRQALAQSSGALSKIYEGWRADLIEIAGLVEAAIDFSDEADVSLAAFDRARARATPLAEAIARHLDDGYRGEILREGFRVALLGPPNAGKSSLLNALARREAAIVSEEAGTTRDVIEVRLDLNGLPVIITDTAGIREAEGAIEREGIRRSLESGGAADLVIWLNEPGEVSEPPAIISRETILYVLSKADLDRPDGTPSPLGERHGVRGPFDSIVAKAHPLIRPSSRSDASHQPATFSPRGEGNTAISTKTGVGIDELIRLIATRAADLIGGRADTPALTQARHRHHLETALAGLRAFEQGSPDAHELRAEDLRRAAHALGRITGRVDVEDILGEIFSRFCIGK